MVKRKRKLTLDNKFYPASNLRQAGLTVYREPICKVRTREEFFLNRLAPIWNNLPVYVIETQSHYFSKLNWTVILSIIRSENIFA